MTRQETDFFNRLYADTYPVLEKYVSGKTNGSEAEDILQEAYLQAYRNIHILREHPNPAGWLMLTCKNILLKSIRRAGETHERAYPKDPGDALLNIPVQDDMDSIYMEELQKILSDDTYFLLVKKYVEGYSVEELARQLNITDGACKMRLKRAKKEAAEKIKNFLFSRYFLPLFWII